jgi:hypothetical protein
MGLILCFRLTPPPTPRAPRGSEVAECAGSLRQQLPPQLAQVVFSKYSGCPQFWHVNSFIELPKFREQLLQECCSIVNHSRRTHHQGIEARHGETDTVSGDPTGA